MLRFIPIVLIIFSIVSGPRAALDDEIVYSYMNSQLHGVIYKYYGTSISEKALPICEPNAVCSVIHSRFWLLPIVTRLCRCASGFDCPWQISNDTHSMSLDNRSQLKFCQSSTHLRTCNSHEVALIVRSYKVEEQILNSPPTIVASCTCPAFHYWKHYNRLEQTVGFNTTMSITDLYRCQTLKRCGTNEFCGYTRPDYSSTYYRCSCPKNHLCIYTDRTLNKMNELLYTGNGYRAHCNPIRSKVHDYD